MSICWLSRWGQRLQDLCIEAKKCLISRDVQFNEVAMINNLDQVTSAIDINTSDTQATVEIDQGEKIEVELSNAYEDKIQPEAIEAESQDAEVTEGEVPQATDLQQYQRKKTYQTPSKICIWRYGCICLDECRRCCN